MSPVDESIADLLKGLSGHWWVEAIRTESFDATDIGEQARGEEHLLPGGVDVTLRNSGGVSVAARGPTVGSAMARAALYIIRGGG